MEQKGQKKDEKNKETKASASPSKLGASSKGYTSSFIKEHRA